MKLLAYQMFHVISTKPLKIAPYAIEADSLLSAVVLSVVFSEELNLANQPSSMVKVVDHIRKHSMNFFFCDVIFYAVLSKKAYKYEKTKTKEHFIDVWFTTLSTVVSKNESHMPAIKEASIIAAATLKIL